MSTETETASYVVKGQLRRRDGLVCAGATVTLVVRRLRSETDLGTAVTNADGHFRIEYSPPGDPVDLVITATDGDESIRVVHTGVSPEETVDLTLSGPQRSEYENLLADIRPLLDGAEVEELIEDETRQDLSFLSRVTGHDVRRVQYLTTAARHSAGTGLPAELFYGLFRQGCPLGLSELAQERIADLKAALAAAAAANVIRSAENAEEFATALRAHEVATAMVAQEDKPMQPVAEIIAMVVPDTAARERIYDRYLEHPDDTDAFLAELAEDPNAERLGLALRLGGLTDNNTPLIRELLTMFDSGQFRHPRDLVRADWENLINTSASTTEMTHESISDYAESLRDRVAAAYPGAYVTHRLLADPAGTETPAGRFLRDNPEFDLIGTPVNTVAVPDGQTRDELAGIQRTLKIAPKFEAMQALRDKGFTSSYAVSSIGRDAFARQVADAMTEDEANTIHARAVNAHATAVNLVADLRTAGQIDVPWLPKLAPLTAQIPDWEELFGSADYCACKECRSLYSQAAYLADLLFYLRRLGGSTTPSGVSGDGPVADVLYARRADLWDIELSCDNTDLSLPYIDLVNELLESAIAPEPGSVIDPKLRQSSGDSAQLRVQPQHVNAGAYGKLRSAVYPWDLPFDLWGERGRSYLGHLGVQRHEMIVTLSPFSTGSDRVVAEYLGLSAVGRRIVASEPLTPARTLPEFYGRPATTPPGVLANQLATVRTMLDTGGMRYDDLVRLLDTRFVNHGGLAIRTTDPEHPCDTTKLTIVGLNGPALDRLHRFVRLQRALGWSALDLDRVIAACRNEGRLDAPTLRCITAINQLAERLGLPVERVLVFYGPVDTRRYDTATEPPLYDRLFTAPAVVTPQPGVPNPFELNHNRTELKVIGSLVTPAVTAALLGILEVTDDELAELVAGPRAVIPDTVLNLANLSALVRTVVLAKAVALPISDLVRLIEIHGSSPFGTSATQLLPVDAAVLHTAGFLDAVDAIKSREFSVPELDAVLTATVSAHADVIPNDEGLAGVLTTLRAALQSIHKQTDQTTDEKGELTRKHLALLGWDNNLVSAAVSTLLGAVTYRAPLAALPAGVVLPGTPALRYDPDEKQLMFTGPLNASDFQTLAGLSADPAYRTALQAVRDAPRTFVTTRMKALRIPIHSAPLAALPSNFVLPKDLAGKVFFDVTRRELRSRAYLSETELALLDAASVDPDFKRAVAALRAVQDQPPASDNTFLTAAHNTVLFDSATTTAADRFAFVLTRLAPYLRRVLSETVVKQQLGQASGVDEATADLLLGTWLRSTEGKAALEDFLDPRFIGSDPAVAVTRAGFPSQFRTLRLLYRVGLVLSRLRVTADQLQLVFGHAPIGWLDLKTLPADPVTGASPLFRPFIRLLNLGRARDVVPGGASTLQALFSLSRTPGVTLDRMIDELSRQTSVDRTELATLAGMASITSPQRLADEQVLLRLFTAAGLVRRLGVSADRVGPWLSDELTAEAAQAIWQAVKARHTIDDWPTVAAPMQDRLRDRQRTALVSYLVANPLRAADQSPQWRDTNTMYDYFLLDVEMGPAQQTTRIAQAIYSVQLFVQRCLLNLEPRVTPSDNATWREWEWSKQYRLWEANQKVFLYPENYFEPDLRPDKSPFFRDLENELMQKEVTPHTSETAIRHYLEKFQGVARLLPCGSVRHVQTQNSETVYVFAKTDSVPSEYYFREWIDRSYWKPWQKVDIDIQGGTLVPMIWNGQVYLFWPTFVETADPIPVTMPAAGGNVPQARKYLRIQLNWSRYVNGRWQAKRTGVESISTQNAFNQSPAIFRFWESSSPFAPEFIRIGVVLNEYLIQGTFADMCNGDFTLHTRSGVMTADGLRRTQFQFDPATPLLQPHRVPTDTVTVNNEFVEVSPSHDTSLSLPDPRFGQENRLLGVFAKTIDLGRFRVLLPPYYADKPHGKSWVKDVAFFTDSARCFTIEPDAVRTPEGFVVNWRIRPFYHPFTEQFAGRLNAGGLDGLFDRELQISPKKFAVTTGTPYDFVTWYKPANRVYTPYPDEVVDFSYSDANSSYNWELFFHIPLLLAQRLSTNQRFAEAQQWFHRIFDPTDTSDKPAPQRFWRTKPFFERTAPGYQQERIEDILRRLATGDPEVSKAVARWLANPFQPDVVAQHRTTAYQKAVVMKYLDNLIAWGDQLFRQDTLESVNQATQLYILAAELLGRRPEEVPDRTEPAPASYRKLTAHGAMLTTAIVNAENLVPAADGAVSPAIAPVMGLSWLGYFRIPRNEKLMGYWDTVADRLFKIRHGQNIEGVERGLALFGAPIDPSVLVRAMAAGVPLSAALDDISAPQPHYRFASMISKAKELANEVKAFGAALLSALEKRDAEALARLRSGHEMAVLDAARGVRAKQVQEADESVAAAIKSLDAAVAKRAYYRARPFMNDKEKVQLNLGNSALRQQEIAATIDIAASVISFLPDIKLGPPTTLGATWGSSNIIAGLRGISGALSSYAAMANAAGSLAATHGGYERRDDDWKFQAAQAEIEMGQVREQIDAARIRKAITEVELANHDKQRANAEEADRFLRDKFTGQELFDWLAGQLTTNYFQSYQLAYDVAKRAERAYRHELGVQESSFIQFGYWDSLYKGLLAGERLTADLNRMDASYLELNAREFELTKHVSLAQLDPNALLRLKQTGKCFVSLPEAIFDLDCPGHYMRRLRNVAITVPCVAGPYTGVNMTMTLVRSTVRVDPRLNGGKYARQPGDTRFRDRIGAVESVVTSTGQEDTGLFETSLRDERYLPFEGEGAVSEWQLSLPGKFRQFDYESISDVVLHVRYTAREGGSTLGTQAVDELDEALNSWVHSGGGKALYRAFSARREFSEQWSRFLTPSAEADPAVTFRVSKDRFSFLFRGLGISVGKPEAVLVLSRGLVPDGSKRYLDCYTGGLDARLAPPTGSAAGAALIPDPSLGGIPRAGYQSVTGTVGEIGKDWTISIPRQQVATLDERLRTPGGTFNPEAVVDLLLVFQYTLTA